VSWPVIGLEFASSLTAIALVASQLREGLPLRHAVVLSLVLLLVPFWHLFLKSCGHVTFVLEGTHLLTQHYPFATRNRRIPIAEILGIQVKAELDDEGKVTHYSLLLVRDSEGSNCLVDRLPTAEDARVLAQQIEALVRSARTR